MDSAINDTAARKNAESTDQLSSLIFEKQPLSTTFGHQPIEPQPGSFQLPKIDFVISHGQQESSYFSDGTVIVQKTDKKVDPECANGVRSADGSEQRFDNTGLCKLTGNVHWGKTVDGVMQIDVGSNVKIGLDKNWHLVNVQGEHNFFKAGDEINQTKALSEKPGPAPDYTAHGRPGQAQAADHAEKSSGLKIDSTDLRGASSAHSNAHKPEFHKTPAHRAEAHKNLAGQHNDDTTKRKAAPSAVVKPDVDLNGIY